ncbi:MAG TPA: GGDEF domain-containing protein [Candidatus Saccharimonadales bacterium]|nr:GGDEF domain-containing protein [Candidatus Saccharimonadales bacterium]
MSEKSGGETERSGETLRQYEATILALTHLALRLVRDNARLEHEKADLEHKSRMDSIIPTMLNKKGIGEVLEQRVAGGKHFAVFMIDINNFKRYNDTKGHPAGDDLLRALGEALQQGFKRSQDILGAVEGRIGGDEFVIIVDLSTRGGRRTSDPIEQMNNVYTFTQSLVGQMLNRDEFLEANNLGVSVAIGGAHFDPEHPVHTRALLEQADVAMYVDKGSRGR